MFSKAFDENKKMNCQNNSIFQCSNAAANEWKEKKNEKMINVGKKSTKNVKIKKIIKEKFLKKKKNLHTIIFDVINVKNWNAVTVIKYHIDDTIMISRSFTKFSFEFENLSEKKHATQTQKKKQKKKKNSKKNESLKKTKEKKTNEWISFLYLTFI